jgi:glutamate/tyrosine decarboxylase-like PLP-dependent enzyme
MIADSDVAALSTAYEAAVAYIESLPHRRVDATREASAISDAAGRTLPDEGLAPAAAVRSLIDMFESGTVTTGSPRFFGWVVGAAYPAAVAADWITSAWDQLAGPALASPAADAAETVVARWLTALLGLPDEAAVGFVTGGQMANFTALAAARHQQLARHGWDVEQRGLFAAPPLTVVTSHERHNSIDAAARYLGFGIDALRLVDGDDEGRIDPQALKAVLRRLQGRPVVVVLNAGTVNTGGFDEFTRCICEAHRVDAWVHVDGAFGLWAAAEGSVSHSQLP